MNEEIIQKSVGISRDYFKLRKKMLGKMDAEQTFAMAAIRVLNLPFINYRKMIKLSDEDVLTLLTELFAILDAAPSNDGLRGLVQDEIQTF